MFNLYRYSWKGLAHSSSVISAWQKQKAKIWKSSLLWWRQKKEEVIVGKMYQRKTQRVESKVCEELKDHHCSCGPPESLLGDNDLLFCQSANAPTIRMSRKSLDAGVARPWPKVFCVDLIPCEARGASNEACVLSLALLVTDHLLEHRGFVSCPAALSTLRTMPGTN